MPTYIRLTDYKSSEEKERGFFKPENRYETKQEDFEKIPGSPIAYWVSEKVKQSFQSSIKIEDLAFAISKGIFTGNNDYFLKYWHEVNNINSNWKKYSKSGGNNRWYGLLTHVLRWHSNGEELKKFKGAGLGASKYYDKPHIVWSGLTSGDTSFRYEPRFVWFDDVAPAIIFDHNQFDKHANYLLGFGNSIVANFFLKLINPTFHYQIGDIKSLPIKLASEELKSNINNLVQQNIDISKEEWDSRETSWDFRINELIRMKNEKLKMKSCKFEDAYNAYCDYWREKFFRLHANEEELNRLFIEIYGLQDELTPDVPLEDITILKNEAKIEDGKLVFQKEEIVKQLISYGVGVMFGRYSLDHEGLHIADMGVSLEEANEKFGIDHPTFEADDDNIIPVLEDDYFDDDIVGRFREFLKAAFGEEYLEENIRFVEEALGKSLRRYFVKDFYEDHIKRYKKRPICWMVSSPKHAFNALFYMHRYRPDIFARIQTGYLHEYMAKLEAKLADARRIALDESGSAKERKEAQKEITRIEKALKELRAFDNEALSHYAAQSVEIDLDDGVKVNYCRFKEILWPIKGLCK